MKSREQGAGSKETTTSRRSLRFAHCSSLPGLRYIRPVHFPGRPSLLRRALLAPLALAYAAGAGLHRALWLRPRYPDRAGWPPLIVIGSLRAGGAGKTAVTLELARRLRGEGLRVGILAYRLHGRRGTGGGGGEGTGAPVPDLAEVFPDSDWRTCSDEAVLLARAGGARVFVTRDRERAWRALGRAGGFDILLSDDGIMDGRLQGAFRMILAGADESPGWTSLLPAGPYRLTASSLARADFVLRPGKDFTRRPLLPAEWAPDRSYWMLCGLGNPAAFARALEGAGVRLAGYSAGPDHGLPDPARAARKAARAGVDAFLCSEKDWIKLETLPDRPPRLFRVGEAVTLAPEVRHAALRHASGLVPPSRATS